MMQVLCGRIVRNNGIGSTQNHHQLQENPQRRNVEISKSWFYIGSANLSPSAWYSPPTKSYSPPFSSLFRFCLPSLESLVDSARGNKVVMDKALQKPKITIRNWECGIICRPERLGFGSDSWHVLKQFVDIDRAVPVTEIGRPWILEEN
jgi:Tyrosyl-DNA phosphodiesterase